MTSNYQLLARKFFSWFGPSGFWAGSDHFLYAQGFIIEDYRRFYFEDIQAIIIQPSISRNAQALVYAMGAGVSIFPMFHFSGGARLMFLISTVLFLLLMLFNLLKGPTCTFRIVTAASDCRIRTFNRLVPARKFRAELVRRVEAVQGSAAAVQVRLEAVPPGPLRPQRREEGAFHILAVVCMLGMTVISLFLMLEHNRILLGLTCLVMLVTLVASVGALVRQRNSDMPPALRAWTWGVFGNFNFDLTLAYLGLIAMMIAIDPDLEDATGMFADLSALNPFTGALLDSLYFFFFLRAAMLAVTGLVLISMYLRKSADDAAGPGDMTGAAPGGAA